MTYVFDDGLKNPSQKKGQPVCTKYLLVGGGYSGHDKDDNVLKNHIFPFLLCFFVG